LVIRVWDSKYGPDVHVGAIPEIPNDTDACCNIQSIHAKGGTIRPTWVIFLKQYY